MFALYQQSVIWACSIYLQQAVKKWTLVRPLTTYIPLEVALERTYGRRSTSHDVQQANGCKDVSPRVYPCTGRLF